jgi:uncharacterized protein (TIGR00369 family)
LILDDSAKSMALMKIENNTQNSILEGNRKLVERIFRDAPFVRLLEIRLGSFGLGWCETSVNISPDLQQQHGLVHAGVLMTMFDHTCGGAAASTVFENKDVITVENHVSFLSPASGTILSCRAEVLRAGRNLIFVEADLSVNREGKLPLVAKATSTLAVTPQDRKRNDSQE